MACVECASRACCCKPSAGYLGVLHALLYRLLSYTVPIVLSLALNFWCNSNVVLKVVPFPQLFVLVTKSGSLFLWFYGGDIHLCCSGFRRLSLACGTVYLIRL